MTLYLLKVFDADGRLIGRNEFTAMDDREAEGLMPLEERRSQELWCGRRWVLTRSPERRRRAGSH